MVTASARAGGVHAAVRETHGWTCDATRRRDFPAVTCRPAARRALTGGIYDRRNCRNNGNEAGYCGREADSGPTRSGRSLWERGERKWMICACPTIKKGFEVPNEHK